MSMNDLFPCRSSSAKCWTRTIYVATVNKPHAEISDLAGLGSITEPHARSMEFVFMRIMMRLKLKMIMPKM